jgi:adenosylcobinamide amidohydrolase
MDERTLAVRFAAPHRVLSWAVVNGGAGVARAVAWVRVRNAELGPEVDPADLLRARLAAAGLPGAVGLLTSADLASYTDAARERDGMAARCVATVGMGNALRAGDPPWSAARVGTINLLVRTSFALTEGAMLETLALASEARALAVREAAVPSVKSGLPASGTGTDCIVVAAPLAGDPHAYAGKHTVAGHLVGAAVEEAIRTGVARWQAARAAAARG